MPIISQALPPIATRYATKQPLVFETIDVDNHGDMSIPPHADRSIAQLYQNSY